MMTLAEFLETQEERLRAEEAAREAAKDRWVRSVSDLIETIWNWLRESDSHKLLKINRRIIERSEEAIGVYQIPTLDIRLGARCVHVEPVAMTVMGPRWKSSEGTWVGRVDLLRYPSSYEMFQFAAKEGPESWYIRESQTRAMELLSKESFDRALVELFS